MTYMHRPFDLDIRLCALGDRYRAWSRASRLLPDTFTTGWTRRAEVGGTEGFEESDQHDTTNTSRPHSLDSVAFPIEILFDRTNTENIYRY